MNASGVSSPPAGGKSLRRAMLSLGLVTMIDMLIQVLLPMVLVRLLSGEDFSQYRLLWLISGTAIAVLPMAMPNSLFYFLPRSSGAERSAYLTQAALFMLLAGLVATLGTWIWGAAAEARFTHPAQTAAFVGMWLFSSLLDVLFNAQQRGPAQAGVNLAFAILRLVLVAGSAWITRSFAGVLIAHLLLAALKALLCAELVRRQTAAVSGDTRRVWRWREQFGYAAPFGASSGLYLLRCRIDQWLVAAMFSTAQFGLYSVASVFSPIQGLIRSSVNNVVLPELSQLQANENNQRMFELNRRGNLAVALVMFPVLAFLFAVAQPLLAALFTADFGAAAPVVRFYCVMLLIESVEVTTLLMAQRQGRFMMVTDALLLPVSIVASYAAAHMWGMQGAAFGVLLGTAIQQGLAYRRCSRLTTRPIAQMQDWGALARILLATLLAAAGASLLSTQLGLSSPAAQVAVCAAGFAILYWVALRLAGLANVVREVFGQRLARLAIF